MIRVFAVLLLMLYSFFSFAYAGSEPSAYPSNWGSTGLMEIPNARVMREKSFRIGASQVKPYRYYYGTVSPLKGLEIGGRVVEILDVPALTEEYGNYKDKAIDLKYQLISEGKYMPALSAGLMDPHGTRLYSSQYITASKQIYPFDFTVGFGNGRYGKKSLSESNGDVKLEMFSSPGKWLEDSQFFGGIQFAPSDKFAFMLEYSPVKYHRQTSDPAQKKYFTEAVNSKFNFGIRYKPVKWAEIDLSFQRGEEIGVNVSMAFDIGKPLIPLGELPYKEDPVFRTKSLSERIAGALSKQGFSDIGVIEHENVLWIEARNDRYYYSTKAIGVVLRSMIEIAPDTVEEIHFVLTENGIPQIEYVTLRKDIELLYAGKLTLDEYYYISEVRTDVLGTARIQRRYKKRFRYGIKPSLETFVNDPSGFFKYRLGLAGWASYNPWDGSTIISALEGYPLNNISTTNEPLSIPVRSDIVLYKEKKASLGRLMIDQIYKAEHELYGKVSAGLLELQYAGLDAEIAKPLLNGGILLGISGSVVKKRDPDNPLKFKNNDVKDVYTTAFLNTRINIPSHELSVDIKAGRFLAGDNGVRFTVSKFINGVILKVWYSITDTSGFTDKFNRGYDDKGISVSIPIRLFTGSDSKSVYHYSLTPWTRDTGQDIDHFDTLFDFIGRNTKIHVDADRKMLYR